MAKISSDRAVQAAKIPAGKTKARFSCGDGLVLELRAGKTGVGRYWLVAYRHGGKRKDASLGRYLAVGKPGHVSFKDARRKLVAIKDQLEQGVDPNEAKKETKRQLEIEAGGRETYREVAQQWYERKIDNLTEKHGREVWARQELHVFPILGSKPVEDIKRRDTVAVINRLVKAEKIETARKLKGELNKIFNYAANIGVIETVPMGDMGDLIPTKQVKHFAAILEPERLGVLLRAIEGYQGSFPVRLALKLLPLVMLRPGEFRKGKWADIDLDAAIWKVPSMDRKQRKANKLNPNNYFMVPLSKQAVEILRELKPYSGFTSDYLFPSTRSRTRPISDNTLCAALDYLGFGEEQKAHGFRATFSTMANNRGVNPEIVEKILSHQTADPVRAAYMRSDFLDERRRVLQDWANYLDSLRAKN